MFSKTTKIYSIITLFIIGLTVAACNTIKGAGQDIEAAGDAIENTADENKNY